MALMSTKNMLIAGGAIAIIAGVLAWSKRAKAAAVATVAPANAAAIGASQQTTVQGMGADPVAPATIGTTAATVSAIAPIVQTTVTTVAGVAGLALTLMSVKEKKMALRKAEGA